MIWWGMVITFLIALAMLPGFIGLLVAGPVIGHATWHAYKQVMSLVPPRKAEFALRSHAQRRRVPDLPNGGWPRQ